MPALAAAMLSGVVPVAAEDRIDVPGGVEAVARLVGHVDTAPEAFVGSLNRVLLEQVHRQHRWEDHAGRAELVAYFEDLELLVRKHGYRIELAGESRETRRRFSELAGDLGFRVRDRRGRFELEPRIGGEWERRRGTAHALGWDVGEMAEALHAGARRTLTIETDAVRFPVSADMWRAITARELAPRTALVNLVKDQRAGLLLEGLRRLSPRAVELLGREGLAWFYSSSPTAFYRYAAALDLEDGAVVLPGGAPSAWSYLTGHSPRSAPHMFLRSAFAVDDPRAAYLLAAMRWVSPAVAEHYLGAESDGAAAETRFLRRFYRRLDQVEGADYARARGGDLGFGVLIRSVPLDEAGSGLALPGVPALWYGAISRDEVPASRGELVEAGRRAERGSLDEADFLLRALRETVRVGVARRSALPRLIRAANLFPGQPEMLTPGVVILAARGSDRFPLELAALDDFTFDDPLIAEDYVLALAQLDSLPEGADRELAISLFQGGVEWLRWMAVAARVPEETLTAALRRWSLLHHAGRDPEERAWAQLEWVVERIRELPSAGEDAPGRGPQEAAYLAALVGRNDPQSFTWRGIDYEGERGRALREAMARHLELQAIPSADQLLAIADGLVALRGALERTDLGASHAAARAVQLEVRGLPPVGLLGAVTDRGLQRRILPVDRPELVQQMQAVLQQRRAGRLPRQIRRVENAQGLLARELRQFLLAPPYLMALAESTAPELADPHLVRKHLMLDVRPSYTRDYAWTPAQLGTPEGSPLGNHVIGSLRGVGPALAELSLARAGGTEISDTRNLTRGRAWLAGLGSPQWHRIPPELSRLVAAFMDAGQEIVQRARAEAASPNGGPYLRFAEGLVPTARLLEAIEDAAHTAQVAPSERMLLGLGALAGEPIGEPSGLSIADSTRDRFEAAVAELGHGWRVRLHLVATPTPHLNGKSRPWVERWPPYEAVERERQPTALIERELLDLKVALVGYLGRNELPGEIGEDLMALALQRAMADLRLESRYDWEGVLRWIRSLEQSTFDEMLRELIERGDYLARFD